MKSNAAKRLPKPRVKGTGAEADAVARVLLAVRRISALLSLRACSCGELSHTILSVYYRADVVACFSRLPFFIRKYSSRGKNK